jgi:hypothetical protein
MPIEIKELNIRINVNQNQPEQDAPPQQATAQTSGNNNKEEMIAECIEQVMEILKNKMDR